jgi:F0F1-type ATP synthase membrane subunit b/b'
MLDIWLTAALFCFVSFFYIKSRHVISAFLNAESLKIRKEFLELEDLKAQVEKLKGATLKKFDSLPKLKSQILETTKSNAESLIAKKRRELEVLREIKIASIEDLLALTYKRKEIAVKTYLLNHTHQFLSEKLTKNNSLDPRISVLEIEQLVAKM